jgi:Zn-dependent metalloprotease
MDRLQNRLVYVQDNGALKLAYQFSFPEPNSPSYWDILVDANTGNIISKLDLNLSCNFHHDAILMITVMFIMRLLWDH